MVSHKEYTQIDEFRLLCETLRERSTLDPFSLLSKVETNGGGRFINGNCLSTHAIKC
ncbi:hypothetical protein [Nostoc sp. FACHB-892]|uniref:hypothetical protein n=1 Tax=Nostoc sp. FACHB-892 TaxID=2692843 RepID=UPI0016881C23|nr:hypothetical protein [Nostoc sp. FACHB-892]